VLVRPSMQLNAMMPVGCWAMYQLRAKTDSGLWNDAE
jgi:hypothetical protein